MCGGVAALIGAIFLGPRIGKYDREGKPKAIPGHNLPIGALGVFILWFCWFGFNGGSTVSMTGEAIKTAGKIFVNTNLCAATAACTVMCLTWVKYEKPDISLTLNGSLAGLVAITAGCDTVSMKSTIVIAVLSGFAVVYGVELLDRVMKVDDPVGAVSVHGICGALGTICVGLFSDGTGTDGKGLLTGGGFKLFGVQCLGVLTVIVWVAVTMIILFAVVKKCNGLRVSKEDELTGLDISEHNMISAYSNFMVIPDNIESFHNKSDVSVVAPIPVSVEEAVPVVDYTNANAGEKRSGSGGKITQISILCNQSHFEDLKTVLNDIGVTGITVMQVLGCGVQKGAAKYFRGVPIEMQLLPKIKVDVVVAKIPVRKVIENVRNVLYTGNIGDGKIFIYDVENVVKVRTGEEGYAALQYSDVLRDDE